MNLDPIGMCDSLKGGQAQVRPLSLLDGLVVFVADCAQFGELLLGQAVSNAQFPERFEEFSSGIGFHPARMRFSG